MDTRRKLPSSRSSITSKTRALNLKTSPSPSSLNRIILPMSLQTRNIMTEVATIEIDLIVNDTQKNKSRSLEILPTPNSGTPISSSLSQSPGK